MRKRCTRQMVFHIELIKSCKPEIWRRFSVLDNLTFEQFHCIIQEAFGWWDCHLHEFERFGKENEGNFCVVPELRIRHIHENMQNPFHYAIEIMDETKITFAQVFTKESPELIYTYDFGDCWHHSIILESIIDEQDLPIEVTDGKGACPPEDCGGMEVYANLKKVMKNPKDEEYDDYVQWLPCGKYFNPNEFSLMETNIRISKMLRMGGK